MPRPRRDVVIVREHVLRVANSLVYRNVSAHPVYVGVWKIASCLFGGRLLVVLFSGVALFDLIFFTLTS